MLPRIILILLTIFLVSCKDEITVVINKEPGKIAGTILPKGISANVELYQGPLIQEAETNGNGVFILENVEPGQYQLVVKAKNRRTTKVEDVLVEDGMGYDIGEIVLSDIPYPILNVSPSDGSYNITTNRIQINFLSKMNAGTLNKAITVFPNLMNENRESVFNYSAIEEGYFIRGVYKLGTKYTVSIDTSARTIEGQPIEFPYTFSFTTDRFKVNSFSINNRERGIDPLILDFNSYVGASLTDYIDTDPKVEVEISNDRSRRIIVTPRRNWISDTTITVFIRNGFEDVYGNVFASDTSFSFSTDPLEVTQTTPYNGQHYFPVESNVNIRFNYILDESTINNAISITNNIEMDIHTFISSGTSEIVIYRPEFNNNTEYTLTIDKSLKDISGNSLEKDFTLKFVTAE